MITLNWNSFLDEIVFVSEGVYLVLFQVKADKSSTLIITLFSLKRDTKKHRYLPN